MSHRPMLRLLALLAGAVLMGAQQCDDNLGQSSPGPVSFRASIARGQVEANGESDSPTISADGRYVCFSSWADNLAGPTSQFKEIFVRDRWLDTVRNFSSLDTVFDPNTQQDCLHPFMSPNGQWVVFESKGELTYDISSGTPENFPGVLNLFKADRDNPGLQRVLTFEQDADCIQGSVSDDGRYIAFVTAATNVPGVVNASGTEQVYVADLFLDTVTLISHAIGAPTTICNRRAEFPRISADGQFVVFQSQATNLTAEANPLAYFDNVPTRRIYVAARDGTGMELVSRASGLAGAPADNHCGSPSISNTGRYVAFTYQGGTMVPGAVGGSCVVRRDRDPGALTSDLAATDAFIFALFISYGSADNTGISDDGRHISYTGVNAAVTDLEIKVRDLQGGTTTASKAVLTSASTLTVFPGNFLSADGKWVVWTGESPLEVIGDTNAVPDVFGYGPIP